MQRRDETDQQRAEATGERTRFIHPIDRANRPSIDDKPPSSIDIRPKPPSIGPRRLCKSNRWTCTASIQRGHCSLQMANGADNFFIQQHTIAAHQQRVTKEFYDTAGGIDNRFKKFYWEEKDKYGVYRDDKGCARNVDEHIINVSKDAIRKLMERASRDEHRYICLPKHASSFTHTKLMKLDGVYYPLNDSISWLTTCMEEMRQDIAKIQHAADKHRPTSIDRHYSTSIDDEPKNSHPMKSQPDFNTRAEIDQLVEEIYRTLETIEERLDRREIHGYIARRPEASASIDRRNNKSTDSHRQTTVDDAINRARQVPNVTSDMPDTHNHGEEISADTYATLMRHQFNLESPGDRLQKIENTTATMKEKYRRGDEAMVDFTDSTKDTKVDQPVNYVTLAKSV
ncbi:hypothetical protein F2Q68_00034293 [Brassica cretica]|uniref:Uncharacterized protein n=2 Tax=Brassica cretica TaxID=69181 RepID=A0ABQ7EFY5_BRACR|nr:hypothetical protein F2Q68_00034293 [Brassica cretica]KAF3596148.1 hypothetical protein DY000_02022031 [Brassica cretica]